MKLPSIPEKYRPSKKFITSIGIIAGVALLIFGIRYIAKHPFSKNPFTTIKVKELKNPADADTDNDGLKDWEEALWGTDPKNPDTDANGTPDGRQIDAMRADIAAQQGTDTPVPPEQITETDKLARDIYTSLAIASQGNPDGELSDADSQALQSKIAEYILRRVGNFKEYTATDLTVTVTSIETATTYVAFINKLNTDFKATQPQLSQTITDLTNNTVSPEIAKALGARYLGFALQIKNQPVPQSITQQHLALINAFIRLGTILQGVAVIEDDPLTAFVNGIGLQDAVNTLGDAFGSMGDALTQ